METLCRDQRVMVSNWHDHKGFRLLRQVFLILGQPLFYAQFSPLMDSKWTPIFNSPLAPHMSLCYFDVALIPVANG